ncbi:hypothetical protein D3C73_1229280 [compost metagenome]
MLGMKNKLQHISNGQKLNRRADRSDHNIFLQTKLLPNGDEHGSNYKQQREAECG